MRRNGFTMVELIFVIIIIGILSVAAIPKFGDIKDRAKVNTEYSSLSGLNSAIVAKMEFYKDDNPSAIEFPIDWNGNMSAGVDLDTDAKLTAYYHKTNVDKQVLKGVIKKGDDFKIDAYAPAGADGDTGAKGIDDILFITGAASNTFTGVTKDPDIEGKPDNNDVWVFNASEKSVTVNYDGGTPKTKVVQSGEITLIDIAGSSDLTYSTTNGAGVVNVTLFGDATATAPTVVE